MSVNPSSPPLDSAGIDNHTSLLQSERSNTKFEVALYHLILFGQISGEIWGSIEKNTLPFQNECHFN